MCIIVEWNYLSLFLSLSLSLSLSLRIFLVVSTFARESITDKMKTCRAAAEALELTLAIKEKSQSASRVERLWFYFNLTLSGVSQ